MTVSLATDPPVLCIMGPTASGKTALAIALAERLSGELISVDSALVYRGLDIGAAKPSFPHHLIGIRDLTETYNAADFVVDANRIIDEVRARQRVPILVGGSMLYFRALLFGLDEMPATDLAIRQQIALEAEESGWPSMHEQLAKVDPTIAAAIHPNHSQRICRALGVWRQSGIAMSDWQSGARQRTPRPHVGIAIIPQKRHWLHQRIAKRFEQMLAAGFLDEVERLRAQPALHPGLPGLRSVGYRQLWMHLDRGSDFQVAREQALAATRQLAKRQITWLRSWPALTWLETDAEGELLKIVGRAASDFPGGSLMDAACHTWRALAADESA